MNSKKSVKSTNKTKVENKNKEVKKNESKIKNFLLEYLDFYKTNIRKKHIVVYIISLLIFFIVVANLINNIEPSYNNSQETYNISFIKNLFVEKLLLVLVILFSGFTPFVFIPVLGFFTSFTYAQSLVQTFYLGESINTVLVSIGIIIQLFGISLSIATGVYYCTLSSKRFRYNQSKGYSMNDIKKKFYLMTKKEDKLEKINKKIEAKAKKNEKLNVKIPYKKLLVSAVISFIIVMVGTIISKGV